MLHHYKLYSRSKLLDILKLFKNKNVVAHLLNDMISQKKFYIRDLKKNSVHFSFIDFLILVPFRIFFKGK